MIKYSKISIDVRCFEKRKVLSFFLNFSRVAARLMSVGRAFHRRRAAELKALSPTRRRVRGTNSSEFVAERRLIWSWSVETGCSMSEMYAGVVQYCPITGTLARISWIRYVQQQEVSVNRSVHWSHVRVDAISNKTCGCVQNWLQWCESGLWQSRKCGNWQLALP